MTDTAPVSVIIPAFNAAPFLRDAVASLQAQTLRPAAVLVIDDGSTDETGAVARDLGVRYIRQDNAGPAAARNRGIRECDTPLVAFLDADDSFLADKLARQVTLLESAGAVASCTDAWDFREGQRIRRRNEGRALPPRIGLDELLEENPVICSTVLAQRQAVLDAGGFDEDRELIATEDFDLWLRLVRQGPLAYLDEPLTDYRVHDTSLSNSLTFLRGIDKIAAKVASTLDGDSARMHRLRLLRAKVRVNAAYDQARCGEGRCARQLLREARALGAARWPAFKILLRSLLR